MQNLPEENEVSSSSSGTVIEPSVVSKTEELEISPEKPSPISVLEPLFSDDDISPARTVSRPGKFIYIPWFLIGQIAHKWNVLSVDYGFMEDTFQFKEIFTRDVVSKK